MKVLFKSRDANGDELHELAVSRLRFVTRRLAWLIPRATVRLSDVNGPRGGVDKRCQVEFRMAGRGTVVITSLARSWRDALDSALARSHEALLRLLRHERRQRTPARRLLAFDR